MLRSFETRHVSHHIFSSYSEQYYQNQMESRNQQRRLRLKDKERTCLLRYAIELELYRKSGEPLQTGFESVVSFLKDQPNNRVRQTTKDRITVDIISTQLDNANVFEIPEEAFAIVTDLDEHGNEVPILDENGNYQFEVDNDGNRLLSYFLAEDKSELYDSILVWKRRKAEHVTAQADENVDEIQIQVQRHREERQQNVSDRLRMVHSARERVKKEIKKERKKEDHQRKVDRQFKKVMSSAAVTTAKSAMLMASSLGAILSQQEHSSVNQVSEFQNALSSIPDPLQVHFVPTPSDSHSSSNENDEDEENSEDTENNENIDGDGQHLEEIANDDHNDGTDDEINQVNN